MAQGSAGTVGVDVVGRSGGEGPARGARGRPAPAIVRTARAGVVEGLVGAGGPCGADQVRGARSRGGDRRQPGRWTCRSGPLGGAARVVARLRREGHAVDAGMATAEYAVVMIAAVGFAGLLVLILSSGEVREALLSLVRDALSV